MIQSKAKYKNMQSLKIKTSIFNIKNKKGLNFTRCIKYNYIDRK